MSRNVCIAIDGPVASGKSTIGRNVARALGFLYLDTGVMYRGVTSIAFQRGIDTGDEREITALARAVRFTFPDLDAGRTQAVNSPLLADGIDITHSLRDPRVDQTVSTVAGYKGVREAMVAQQRSISRERNVVMVGRDIGTVVAPDADVKIYLTATVEERAARRNVEQVAAGGRVSLEETLADLKRRDRLDSDRPISPLKRAADAVVVDTTGLSSEQSLQRVLDVVGREREGAAN